MASKYGIAIAACMALPTLPGHRIVMFGEGHGTKETPAAFLRIVCSALKQGAGRPHPQWVTLVPAR